MPKDTLLILGLFFACSGAWAQDYQTTYPYSNTGTGTDISGVSILHKQPKWIGMRGNSNYGDTFDSNGWTTTENGTLIQAANVSVDTLYVHKGSDIAIAIPYMIYGAVSSASFVRWFDYRTDGNYYCGTGLSYTDLLNADESVGSEYGYGYASDYDGTKVTQSDGSHYVYRFANGYVGGFNLTSSRAIHSMTFHYPSDTEFETISNGNSSFNNGDNSYYIVAADVSMYKDCAATYEEGGSTFGENGQYYEPTLSGRTLFYIIGVEDEEPPKGYEHHWCLANDNTYQGGTNTGNEHYLEEYEITFPTRRIASVRTPELVALSKGANAYAIPGLTNSNNDNTTLNVSFASGEANGFTLVNTTVTGTNRVIQFGVSNGNRNPTYYGQWTVDDGSTATILVTKTVSGTTYNIARYKLTFKEESTLLTQTQVAGLDNLTGTEGYWWEDLTYRSPAYMESHYDLIASQTFSYDESSTSDKVEDGKEQFYPFPIEWDYCGYAFYDGSSDDDVNSIDYGWWPTSDHSTSARQAMYTQWGMYSIVNDYIGYADSYETTSYRPPSETAKDDGGYWLYVDASDIPRTIVEIPFEESLCAGSQLFATAWIKDASSSESANCSGLLFTIMGVYVDNDGNETHEPIYRQCSSQVDMTNYLTSQTDENRLNSTITGKGSGTNQWFQLYFSFINTDDIDYDYYTLKVESYCATTSGGDFYFDEVKIYVLRPDLEMAQIDPICSTGGDNKSLMRLDLNYEAMMSRLGYDPSEYTSDTSSTASVDFVIINEAKYYNALAAIEEETGEAATQTQKEEAFMAAIVTFYDTDEKEHQFPTIDFYLNYTQNAVYDEENPGTNIVKFNSDSDEGFFYRRTSDSGTEELSMDCLSDIIAYTKYIILLEPHDETVRTEEEKLDLFIAMLDDACAISTEFYLTTTTILKINGETADPTADYCAGQELVISPELTYVNSSGETIYLDGVYFDWFFGSVEEYTSPVVDESGEEMFGGVTLEKALLAFRTYYPDAEELSATATPPIGDGETDFTQNHYNIIEYYLGQKRVGGLNNQLVLHTSYLDIRVLTTGIELVIQPIEVILPEDALMVCFGYVPLTLMSSGDAPTLKMGFSNINYPDDDYDPCLRVGLAQLAKCGEDTPFTVNLCNATYVDEDYTEVIHLGMAGNGLEYLFLVDTDDPDYHELILDHDFTQFSFPAGKILRLYANVDPTKNDPDTEAPDEVKELGSYMQICFFNEDSDDGTEKAFTAREGYYYVFDVFFEEQNDDGEYVGDDSDVAMCQGILPFEMKVVPEYLLWTGDKNANWNNDNHWQRVSSSRINGTITEANSSYFTDGNNSNTNGFVPMLFSKVIIPKNSAAELYMAGFIEGNDNMLSWEGDDDTANHDDVSENPTGNIMYDMMLYENPTTSALKTEHYRVNLCDELHFEPGAQMLHAEQLIYNKAWTDVELEQTPWTLVSTPLRDVVSGDWYTKKATGTETAEYFTDITFSSTDNDRYSPMVYQRNWSNEGNKIIYTDTDKDNKTVPAYVSTGWSSVYNDVTIPHQAGEGFSIKASRSLPVSSEDSLMFRFPKADTEYAYQVGTSSSSMTTTSTEITRTNPGLLLISELVDRTDPDKDDDDVYKEEGATEERTITVELTQTGNNYYIIGNPYTAPMSMKEFMDKNTTFVGYWTEATYGPVVGTTDGTSWGTADCLIEPYSAFFVTTEESDVTTTDATPVTVTFTKDMQTFELDETSTSSPVRRQTNFAIRATGEGGTTSASIAYADKATDDYKAGEDAVLMEDVSWQRDGMPLVYTVAGDKAVSVNALKQLTLIPVGAFADDGSLYTLSFVGVDMLESPVLVDVYEDTETPLTEGYALEVEGATHGRYFIKVGTPILTEIEETASPVCEVSAYSPVQRTVVVSSDAGLESVEIYSVDGMLLNRTSIGGSLSCTINGVASGISIVKVKTTEGTTVKKIRVR